MRADDVQAANHIVIDVLKRIISADIVVCDLSSRNPNVLYELGIRQAFNLPVVLIKDSRTERIFDIQGLRDIEYDESLRIDTVKNAVSTLETTLKNTIDLKDGDINSIIQLLGVQAARLPSVEVSPDTSLVLDAIGDLGKRIAKLEDRRPKAAPKLTRALDKNGNEIKVGMRVRNPQQEVGFVEFIGDERLQVTLDTGEVYVTYLPYTNFWEIVNGKES